MKRIFLFLFFGLSIMKGKSQNLDSLIRSKNNDSLSGKVFTYYSPNCKQVALRLQKLVASASNYYEKQYGKKLHIKLAVLDSLHWLTELLPYGFVFYDEGWMVMNTGMKYESFKSVYGLSEFASKLDSSFRGNKITPEKVIQDVYAVYCIHEVGHYFFDKISKTKGPDKWSNELIATYFSYQYFKNIQPDVLKSMEVFSATDSKEYQPMHRSIVDFNTIYESVGIKNYLWYHSNIFFLAKDLYSCYGTRFIPTFERLFPKSSRQKFDYKEIAKLLDKGCHQTVQNWISGLENTHKVMVQK
jgi:hypothetical protein